EKFLLFSRFPYLGFLSSYQKEDLQKVAEISSRFEIEDLIERKISTLSGGELQRVLIASAVIQQTDIIFLDEPTTFLDPNHRWEIFNLIEKINREENKTVVLVTHFLEYVLNFGEKIVALKEGEVYFSGGVKQLYDSRVLNSLYNFKLDIFKHGQNYLIDLPKRNE
ncbi:MAG: ABC transporter ATP-binding protein, partial [Candidatus Mcinerneyibacterium aminivorans]